MRSDITNASSSPPFPSATINYAPVRSEFTTPIQISLDRLVVEGLGPVSPAGLREGFREVLLTHQESIARWKDHPTRIADALGSELSLDLRHPSSTSISSHDLGRKIAEAIIRSAENALSSPQHQPV